jgi:hypothetical protein
MPERAVRATGRAPSAPVERAVRAGGIAVRAGGTAVRAGGTAVRAGGTAVRARCGRRPSNGKARPASDRRTKAANATSAPSTGGGRKIMRGIRPKTGRIFLTITGLRREMGLGAPQERSIMNRVGAGLRSKIMRGIRLETGRNFLRITETDLDGPRRTAGTARRTETDRETERDGARHGCETARYGPRGAIWARYRRDMGRAG